MVKAVVNGDLERAVRAAVQLTDADPALEYDRSFRTDTWDWPETDDPTTNALARAQMKEMDAEAAARGAAHEPVHGRSVPRFLERDEAIRRAPRAPYAWDGVAEVRPFGAMEKNIVEGVY